MANLLRFLLTLSFFSFWLIALSAHGFIELKFGHIEMAIPAMLFLIFVQAFVMFYFIGVARLVENVNLTLGSSKQHELKELFETPPEDLTPYIKKSNQFNYQAKLAKRQTIPWTALILTLSILGFLLGGAHHTNLVTKKIHAGVVYGFLVAFIIGFFRQWLYLGKSHNLLRKLKSLFDLPDNQM